MTSSTRASLFFSILSLSLGPVVLAEEPAAAESGAPAYETESMDQVDDPWEGFNRRIYAFNDVIDRRALKPVAQVYRDLMPEPVTRAISNFFSNLGEPFNLANNLLQGKAEGALITSGRFVFNSTFGLGGLIDVATAFELPEQDEDFGQTLGYWGASSGPFLMLPLLGPSTVRDAGGLATRIAAPGIMETLDTPDRYYLYGVRAVDLRSQLIPVEDSLTEGDRYRLIRNAYLQHREFKVNDGQVKDTFSADDDAILEDF